MTSWMDDTLFKQSDRAGAFCESQSYWVVAYLVVAYSE